MGRAFGFLFEKLVQLISLFRGSRDLRIVTIAAAALIVLAIIGRFVVARQLDVAARRAGFHADIARGDRRDFWVLARELAAGGDNLGACHALYAAVIDSLARSGVVKFHASKTSGDYARELDRRGSPAPSDFRAFARRFDRVVYGLTGVTADDYARLADEAQRLVSIRNAA